MPTRLARAWPLRVRTYWCISANSPSLGRECPGGDDSIEINVTEPGDVRPAFKRDIDIIKEAYKNEIKSSSGFERFMGYGVKLLNKVPYMDLMYEVVSEGVVIARVYWDPLLGYWRLRFSMPGLLRIWDKDPLPRFKIRGGLKTLLRSRVFHNALNIPPNSQVVLTDEKEDPIGIAYVSQDGDVVKVHSIFRKKVPERISSKRNTTWDDVIKVNDYYIYYYKSRAIKFLYVMIEKVKKPLLVSFSGGKDSLVALHLTLEAGYKPVLLFNNTGLEMPETIEFVNKISKEWGLELLLADAGDAFWRTVMKVGPPGKDYRWCCKVTKLAPIARILLEKFPEGAINVVGQRAFESLDRARSPRVWRNKWMPHILSITPIQDWSQLAVWIYIWYHKLPYNPLYEKGFDRIGCFMCPAAYVAEYDFVRRTHPDLWRKWENVLEYWASKLGLEGELRRAWIERGLWRWLTPAVQKKRLARRLNLELPSWQEIYNRMIDPSVEGFIIDDKARKVRLRLSRSFDGRSLKDQVSVLGPFKIREEKGKTLAVGPKDVRVVLDDDIIEVENARGILARELLFDALKIMYRWENCAGCKACETSCPTGAIKVAEENDAFRPIVNAERCIHCKLCIDNCPLADVVVERTYIPLIMNEPTAWRRKGKRTHESVVSRYLKFKGIKLDRRYIKEEDALSSPNMGILES